jgi:hypothetical protein
MKTKTNNWKVLVVASLLSTNLITGSNLSAQSDPDVPEGAEVNVALSQLESFIIESEHSIKYKAPFAESDELLEAIENLEKFAEDSNAYLEYHASDFDVQSDDVLMNPVSPELYTQKKVAEVENSKDQSL